MSWQAEELKKLVEMGRPEKRFRSWHAFPLRGIVISILFNHYLVPIRLLRFPYCRSQRVTRLREGLRPQSAICMLEFVTGWLSFEMISQDHASQVRCGRTYSIHDPRQCKVNNQYTSASEMLLEVLIFHAERRLWLPKSESQHRQLRSRFQKWKLPVSTVACASACMIVVLINQELHPVIQGKPSKPH